MPNIFKRISDVLAANLNELIDRVEDPERMVKQIIREMEDNIRIAEEGVIDAIASEKQLQKDLEHHRQQAATWRRQGARYARHHLGRLVPVATVRVLRTWDFWQPRRQIGFAEGRQRRVTQAGTAAYYVLLALAVYGAVAVRRRRAELLTLLAPFVVVTLSTAAGFGLPRFRQAAEISLVVLAAVAVERLLERRRLRTTR